MPDEKIYITRSHIIPEAIAYLDGIYDIEVWQQNSPPPRELLLEKARECDALLTEVTDIVDGELLDGATNLKVVANRAVGLDNIDIPAATRNGILIGNTPGVLHESCADFTFGLILALPGISLTASAESAQASGRSSTRYPTSAPMYMAQRSESLAWA